VDSERNKENMENLLQQEKNKTGEVPAEAAGAEPKQTAFQIAVKVANHSDSKVRLLSKPFKDSELFASILLSHIIY